MLRTGLGELLSSIHALLGQQARPGRCLLNVGDWKLITVTVPVG